MYTIDRAEYARGTRFVRDVRFFGCESCATVPSQWHHVTVASDKGKEGRGRGFARQIVCCLDAAWTGCEVKALLMVLCLVVLLVSRRKKEKIKIG